ncbi:MAG: hypothetical protein HY332_04910 [Chloroflexi bacterium]|nr:hypothetical protein [Chloroflexota bacterium]
MDRFTWAVVAGAVLLVVAGLASVVLLQRRPAPPDLSRPEGVVRAYLEALDSGRPERAWALLAPSARSRITEDEFIRRATAYQEPPRQARIAIEIVDIEGATARVELSRTYTGESGPFGLFGPSAYTNRQTVRLERIGGAWLITVPPESHLIDRPAPVVVVTPPPTTTPVPTPVTAG